MELLQLRYFCTVAKLQNISRGAIYHHIPQPDMSKTISKLEKELGVTLFTRESNRIMLTPKGYLFYNQIAGALRQIDSAVDSLQADTAKSIEELHIFVSVLRSKFSQCLAQFRQDFPNVSVQVSHTMDRNRDDLLFDLCIAQEAPSEEYDCKLPLLSRNLDVYFVVNEDEPLSNKELLELEDLRDIPIAIIQGAPMIKPVTILCKERGFDLNMAITCADLYNLKQYISAGVAATFAFPYSWQELEGPGIRFVKVNASVEAQFCVFWSSKKPRGKAWFSLIEQLQNSCGPKASYWYREPPLTGIVSTVKQQ